MVAGHAEQADGDHDGRRRPGVDAEQARVGERIARERLHQRAGEAERGADGDAEQRARQPEVRDDRRIAGIATVAAQRVDDLAERDRAGADGEAEEQRP